MSGKGKELALQHLLHYLEIPKKEKKPYSAQEHHFISNRKFGWVLEKLSERKASGADGLRLHSDLFDYSDSWPLKQAISLIWPTVHLVITPCIVTGSNERGKSVKLLW